MRLIDVDALNLDYEVDMADDWKTAHEIANCVKYAPTIEAVPMEYVDVLCKELEDRCPPGAECIIREFDGTCVDCWKEYCRDVLKQR